MRVRFPPASPKRVEVLAALSIKCPHPIQHADGGAVLAHVAQGIEQLPSKQSVAGSIPATGTNGHETSSSRGETKVTKQYGSITDFGLSEGVGHSPCLINETA